MERSFWLRDPLVLGRIIVSASILSPMMSSFNFGFCDYSCLFGVGEYDIDVFFIVQPIVEFDPEVAG